MRVGIVGYPGSGKTSVFNVLTGQRAQTGWGGGKGKMNLGVIKVPDERVDRLTEIVKPKKSGHAEIAFMDYAGEPSARANAINSKALEELRNCDAFAVVLRGFDTDTPASPLAELIGFEEELILGDLALAEKRLARLVKEGKAQSRESHVLEKIRAHLDATRPLRLLELTADERTVISGFNLASLKPLLVLVNVTEDSVGEPVPEEVQTAAEAAGALAMVLSASLEMEIIELDPDEQLAFLQEMGIDESSRVRFIQAAYETLGLISFLTTGNEVRAWPIESGTPAVKAAGKVHSDIERGFIRAEVFRFEDFVAYGSEARIKEAGKARVVGKDYVVEDGDVIHFLFNV